MSNAFTIRSLIVWALAGLLGCGGGVVCAQEHVAPIVRTSPPMLRIAAAQMPTAQAQMQPPAPIVRRSPPSSESANRRANRSAGGSSFVRGDGPRGEHLPEWMSKHAGLTLQQQQKALDREPGFRQLPQQTRERMHQRLAQLHAMPPIQRQRMLAHTEAMERLSLPQRAEVRGALEQLGSLPPDQRRQVAESFRELRLVPPGHRMEVLLYSGRYSWLNEMQRITLVHLIQVAQMLPPQ